jgi:lipoprotein-anchoring transpeptidase ErfK/SrfK
MRHLFLSAAGVLVAFVLPAGNAASEPLSRAPMSPPLVVVAQPVQTRGDLGGGFIEFLFGDDAPRNVAVSPYAMPAQAMPAPQAAVAPPPAYAQPVYGAAVYGAPVPQPLYVSAQPQVDPMLEQRRPDLPMDPQFLPREVLYTGREAAGTIIVDTPHHFLYLVEDGGRARRYGIGVGRPGFTWSGEHKITAMKEWPDWVPPDEMLQRQPYLPHFMPGGPNNPLGARAMYIGNTLYRIHGSNEPWTIGHNVSSGCIRMRNVDVIDLYNRVKIGAKVEVLPASPPTTAMN